MSRTLGNPPPHTHTHASTSDNKSFLPYPPPHPPQSGRHMCIIPKLVKPFFKCDNKFILRGALHRLQMSKKLLYTLLKAMLNPKFKIS